MNESGPPPPGSASAPQVSSIVSLALPAAVVLLLGLRIAIGPQLDGLDDAGYLEAAQRVSRGQSLEGLFPLFRTRVAMAYPLGWLLGGDWLEPRQFVWLTLAAECATVLSLYAAGRLLLGRRVGLFAAALYATYPLAVQQGMMYYPTAFQVASIATATALTVWSDRFDGAKRLWLGLAAGLCLGLGYLAKEDVAIVVAAMFLASLIAKFPRFSSAAALCVGAATVFVAESFVYWLVTGSASFRLSSTSGLGFVSQDNLRVGSIYHWDAYVRSLWLLPVQVGVIWWLAIPALWFAIRRFSSSNRHRGLAWLAATFVLVLAYLQFGSGSLTSYSPLPKSPRYTALVTPLLMLIVAAWIDRLFAIRRTVAYCVVVATIALAIPCTIFLAISSSERSRNTLAVLPILDQVGSAPLYTDYYGVRLLRLLKPRVREVRPWYHARFDRNEIVVSGRPSEERGAFVLLDRQIAKIYTSSYEMTLPSSIDVPPANWLVVWRHRAYGEGSLARTLLESANSLAMQLPSAFPLRERIRRSVSEMIDHDDATLYRVP